MIIQSLLAAALAAETVGVTVDFTRPAGPMKPLHGVNNAPVRPQKDAKVWEFEQAGIPYMRTHDTAGMWGGAHYVDIPNVFPDFDADENDPKNYDFAFTDAYLAAVVAAGTKVYYRLGVTIENYYYVKAYNIYPPKDFAKWARICEHVVRHYNEGWANGFKWNIEYWEIWNEPENPPMWQGTREQYFELYRVAANHLKRCFPDIKVGGYGGCGFYALDPIADWEKSAFQKSFLTWFEDFCRYVTDERTKAPLDFYSWHLYVKTTPRRIVTHAKYVRDTLDKAGLAATESHFNEWNYVGPAWDDMEGMRLQRGAACVGEAFCLMQRAPVDKALYYDALPTRSYCGLFRLVGKDRRTTTYHAFRLWNRLYQLGTSVESAADCPDFGVTAAAGGDDLAIYLVNNSPTSRVVRLALKGADGAAFAIARLDDTHDSEKAQPFDPSTGLVLGPHEIALVATSAETEAVDRGAERKVFAGQDSGVADLVLGASASANRAAIQRAIDAAAARGGGRVEIPAGVWPTGSLELKSGVELHLAKGAVLKGSADRADYNADDVFPENFHSVGEEWSGGHLVYAYRAHDIAITGEGTIDGNGGAFFPEECQWNWVGNGYKYGIKLFPTDREWFRPGPMVAVFLSRNFRLEGVTLANTPCWTCHVRCSDGFTAKGVTIDADRTIANSDGFSVDCTRNVKIEGCAIRTGDDGIAVRASCRHHAETNLCANVEIRDCDIWSCCYGVRLGIGTGTITNVVIADSRIHEAAWGIGYTPAWVTGARNVYILDTTVTNTSIRECVHPVHMTVPRADTLVKGGRFVDCAFESLFPSAVDGNGLGRVEDFRFERCSRKTIEHIKVRGDWAFEQRHRRDIRRESRDFAFVSPDAKNVVITNCSPSAETAKGALLLSFEGGDLGDWTRELPLFDRYGAHATFFAEGKIDNGVVRTMKKLRARGHTIGLHGRGADADNLKRKCDVSYVPVYRPVDEQPQRKIAETVAVDAVQRPDAIFARLRLAAKNREAVSVVVRGGKPDWLESLLKLARELDLQALGFDELP